MLDVSALSSTVSAVVKQAIQAAFSPENLAGLLGAGSGASLSTLSLAPPDSSGPVDGAVNTEVSELIGDNSPGTRGVPSPIVSQDSISRPERPFTSISVALSSRVSSKLKAKIFANEYVDFGALLSSSPNNDGKYSLSMSPSIGSTSQPQLTLEPLANTKRVHSIHQWVSAFTIFVSIYCEKSPSETPQLMKYCEVVRDLALKAGDWIWYDEQFRYLRQSAPQQYPWDQIHWELWIRASHNFRNTQPSTNKSYLAVFARSFFQKELVGHFKPESTVRAVSSPMNVLSAAQNTRVANVPSRLPSPEPLLSLKAYEEELRLRVLRSPPVTPVNVEHLEFLLQGYNPALRHYLIHGFRFGFRINFVGERCAFDSPNLRSALERPADTSAKLTKECDAGRIVGPFSTPPFLNFRTSPIGLVPKKDPSEFRLIHHLSYPKGSSVNDFIPDYCSAVKYASVGDATKFIKSLGRGCFMAKTDVKSAFRIIPIHPADYPLLGIRWNNLYYFDRTLAMGLSSSCAIFESFSTALEWLSINLFGASAVLHILDDFLFIAATRDQCARDLQNFILMCDCLGVPLAPEKTVGPDTVLQFAGITLDSIRFEARLPEDKLHKCRVMLRNFYTRRTVTLKELQSLIGLLNFTCIVIVPGRAFLRRLIDLTIGIQKPHHHIRLSKGAKLDLLLWLRFLEEFNGKSFFFRDVWETSRSLHLYTDSAASVGFGAVFGCRWLQGLWPEVWKAFNIAFLELFPIVIAVHVWGSLMADKRITFFSDNAAVVDIINKQTSKHMDIMILLRDLVLSCLRNNILFQARHIPGLKNSSADYISRSQVENFKKIFPEADEHPTPIPENLMPKNWVLT